MQRTLRVQETDLQPNPDFHHRARIYYMLVLGKDPFFRDFELLNFSPSSRQKEENLAPSNTRRGN